jgi:hypothetical protein
MAGFKIVNGMKITTNNAEIATRLRASLEASNDKLNSAIETLFAPAQGREPDEGPTPGTSGSFREQRRT